MELAKLNKEELQVEFLRINHLYIQLSEGSPAKYMNDKAFLIIRKELHAVLDELRRRRKEGE
jgi:hypothetical protein